MKITNKQEVKPMTKKEMILEAIESLGYKPHVDDDDNE